MCSSKLGTSSGLAYSASWRPVTSRARLDHSSLVRRWRFFAGPLLPADDGAGDEDPDGRLVPPVPQPGV